MKLKRETSLKISFLLDNFLPPIIRDSQLMFPLFFLLYREKAKLFFNFKKTAHKLSSGQIKRIYETINALDLRETNLNENCTKEILTRTIGKNVLEIGCGKGYLANKLAEKNFKVTAVDLVSPKINNININSIAANIESLPFKDKEFDTVISTHTLEHVQNIFLAISELRRVAKRRLIIVVPKQKSYRHTFDLHLHFFPYIESLMITMGKGYFRKRLCIEIGGDLFYQEDY